MPAQQPPSSRPQAADSTADSNRSSRPGDEAPPVDPEVGPPPAQSPPERLVEVSPQEEAAPPPYWTYATEEPDEPLQPSQWAVRVGASPHDPSSGVSEGDYYLALARTHTVCPLCCRVEAGMHQCSSCALSLCPDCLLEIRATTDKCPNCRMAWSGRGRVSKSIPLAAAFRYRQEHDRSTEFLDATSPVTALIRGLEHELAESGFVHASVLGSEPQTSATMLTKAILNFSRNYYRLRPDVLMAWIAHTEIRRGGRAQQEETTHRLAVVDSWADTLGHPGHLLCLLFMVQRVRTHSTSGRDHLAEFMAACEAVVRQASLTSVLDFDDLIVPYLSAFEGVETVENQHLTIAPFCATTLPYPPLDRPPPVRATVDHSGGYQVVELDSFDHRYSLIPVKANLPDGTGWTILPLAYFETARVDRVQGSYYQDVSSGGWQSVRYDRNGGIVPNRVASVAREVTAAVAHAWRRRPHPTLGMIRANPVFRRIEDSLSRECCILQSTN